MQKGSKSTDSIFEDDMAAAPAYSLKMPLYGRGGVAPPPPYSIAPPRGHSTLRTPPSTSLFGRFASYMDTMILIVSVGGLFYLLFRLPIYLACLEREWKMGASWDVVALRMAVVAMVAVTMMRVAAKRVGDFLVGG